MAVTQKEVLEYANKIKEQEPDIRKERMKYLLEEKFIHGKDHFNTSGAIGAIHKPEDWLNGLISIISGLKSWFIDKNKKEAIQKIIEGVLIILF